MSTKEKNVTTPFTWEDALACAKEVLANASKVQAGDAISTRTNRSISILDDWKSACCGKDKNLIKSTPNPMSRRFQFALHDKKKGIVYELKLNTSNPTAFINNLIRKLIIYNSLPEACCSKKYELKELANKIMEGGYFRISEVYIFAQDRVIDAYNRPLMVHCFDMIKEKFGVTIIPISLDE